MTIPPPPPSRPSFSEKQISDARKLFEYAMTQVTSRAYDYGIDLYMQGLALWTEAVAEGLRPMRVAAVARQQSGGKPHGFLEHRKYPVTGKDLRQNLLNALRLFAFDPLNPSYLEAILVNSAKLCMTRVGQWVAPILWESFSREKKVSTARCETIYTALDQIGDQLTALEDYTGAQEVFRVAQLVADLWKQLAPTSQDAPKAVSSASSKLTIVKGRFGTQESFTSSLKDAAAQRDLHDSQRTMQEEQRRKELIAAARAAYAAEPDTPGKLFALVEQLTRYENEADELEAIRTLDEAFVRTSNYSFRVKADDLRIRHLRRHSRSALERFRASPTDAAARSAFEAQRRNQLETEERIFRDRIARYPTDMRLQFELGVRLYDLKRIDEAIPAFQQAQRDPKNRDAARLFIGRCFLEKRFFDQAVAVLQEGLRDHELQEDDVGKALRYWLARTYEAMGRNSDAAGAYGQLIQFDYNYADARQRFERLSAAGPA